MNNVLALTDNKLGTPASGIGKLGLSGGASQAPDVFNLFLSSVIGLMTIVAAIWFLFVFFGGAYTILNGGGNKGAFEEGRKKITMGALGLVAIVGGIFLIDLFGSLLGLTNILSPGKAACDIAKIVNPSVPGC